MRFTEVALETIRVVLDGTPFQNYDICTFWERRASSVFEGCFPRASFCRRLRSCFHVCRPVYHICARPTKEHPSSFFKLLHSRPAGLDDINANCDRVVLSVDLAEWAYGAYIKSPRGSQWLRISSIQRRARARLKVSWVDPDGQRVQQCGTALGSGIVGVLEATLKLQQMHRHCASHFRADQQATELGMQGSTDVATLPTLLVGLRGQSLCGGTPGPRRFSLRLGVATLRARQIAVSDNDHGKWV